MLSDSLTVVGVIGAVTSRDPCELAPLQYTVDTGALDTVFSTTDDAQLSGYISFSYEGFEVTVRPEGIIEVAPLEAT